MSHNTPLVVDIFNEGGIITPSVPSLIRMILSNAAIPSSVDSMMLDSSKRLPTRFRFLNNLSALSWVGEQ